MGFSTTRQHLLGALLNSISFRLYDNIKDKQFEDVQKVIVDGGMTKNKEFMQLQADLFQKEIEVRTLDTCWGAAKGVLSAHNIPIEEASFQTTNYLPGTNGQHIRDRYQEWCEERRKFYGWQ